MITKSENISSISSRDLLGLLGEAGEHSQSLFPLAQNNLENIQSYLSATDEYSFLIATYDARDTIVELGTIVSSLLRNHPNFAYAHVPLGVIVKGEVAVQKGGKATKRLSEGDFIGLFETSDWLITRQKREIGDWTLKAMTEVQIVYFGSDALTANTSSTSRFRDYLVNIARQDKVPQPITQLPLLDWVASHTTSGRLKDAAIVINTHLLPNYAPFFRHLAYLAEFGRIFVLEKAYSTVPQAYRELIEAGCEVVQVRMEPGLPYEYSVQKSLDILWSKVIEEKMRTGFHNLLVVSDGGDLLTSIPWGRLDGVKVSAVEQTQRGIARIEHSHHQLPPVVSVASNGVKKFVESTFIGQSVVAKLQEINLLSPDQRVGVIGTGSIGATIVNQLKELGLEVSYYDPAQRTEVFSGVTTKISLDSLVNDSDIVIGTTGTDALRGIAFERIRGHKVLASASSADIEFYTLLKLAPPTDRPFDTRSFQVHDNLTVDVLNGGYPINFDRTKNAVPSQDIVLTYSLMYIATMQAAELMRQDNLEPKIYNLDQGAVRHLMQEWMRQKKVLGEDLELGEGELEQVVAYSSLKSGEEGPRVWRD